MRLYWDFTRGVAKDYVNRLMKPSSKNRSASTSPVLDEVSYETDRLTSITDLSVQNHSSYVQQDVGNASTTMVEFDRRMRLLEDTEEVEPEESNHFEISSIETPRFNADKKATKKPKTDHITFGSVVSSPMSNPEHSRKHQEFEGRTPRVDEMSWEDSTNKREYIISLAKRKTGLYSYKATEDSVFRSPNISMSNMVSIDLESPTPSAMITKESLPEASRHLSMMPVSQERPMITLETLREAKNTGCCGNCLMYIFE
mmetsp:Transcript_19961/g.36948  ORF Transcript_19961/g.36948 Transcript_19961/m.36948 type:complete len:257 (-) Transcript_19961:2756-3526(-)